MAMIRTLVGTAGLHTRAKAPPTCLFATSRPVARGGELLSRVSPFHVLPKSVRQELGAAATIQSFQAGDTAVEAGTPPDSVYVLSQGRLHVYDTTSRHRPSVGQVEAPAFFGERAAIFDRPHNFAKVADSAAVTQHCIPSASFMRAVEQSPAFAQAVARIVRAKQDVLGSFRDFSAAVTQPSLRGQAVLSVSDLEALYREIGPAIHAGLHDIAIDVAAWVYALRRLPANVTRTYQYLLSPTIPPYLLPTVARDMLRTRRREEQRARGLPAAPARVLKGSQGQDEEQEDSGAPAPSQLAAAASSALSFRATAPGSPAMEGADSAPASELPGGTAHESARPVATADRRRYAWEVGGKTVVLLRDESTDLLDFTSLLCTHSIEARKLRRRLQSASHFDALQRGVAAVAEARGEEEAAGITSRVLASLPLSATEREGILQAWPAHALRHMRDVVLHHEDYHVTLDRGRWRVFNADPVELWSHAIRRRVLSLLGAGCGDDVHAALRGRPVHIVSSNTHSVTNCLSPFVHRRRDAILEHANRTPHLAGAPFDSEVDLTYAALPSFMDAHPAEAARRRDEEAAAGISHLTNTRFTGLQVDVVDAALLDRAAMDPRIEQHDRSDAVIINMDYAFGQKAEQMMRVLSHVFGPSIRSVNVLGKAGALTGCRGDVLLPTGCLMSRTELNNTDDLKPVGNEGLTAEELRRVTGRSVHEGVMLTIPGTMLQNEVLLRFYQRTWNCVGLEMEGAYYADQVTQSKLLGLIPDDATTRFAYYTSDLPLAAVEARKCDARQGGDANGAGTEASLAAKMEPWEGVPPLYGITRAFLGNIL